jgi:hypothetical protein
MADQDIDVLPIAIRVYPESKKKEDRPRAKQPWKLPKAMFVFDTETRTDATQSLTFGSYRFIVNGSTVEECLFYGDDLPEKDRKILERYVATHSPDVVREGNQKIRLLSRQEFLDRLYLAAYKGRCLLVGFNLPFDLSRIGCDFTNARGRFAGGFSLGLWSYIDKAGSEKPDKFRPRIGIKHIDSKRALKGFTARNKPDKTDLIPEESSTGDPEKGYKFRGHFLDLRTLAFALTDRGYSLEAACKVFGVEHGKQPAQTHGVITDPYIDYNRRDVLATSELAVKLLEEYGKHPISLQVTRAYSPASIGKAYLREMGIDPILKRQSNFPKEYLGYAETAFFGGRTSAHIRKVPVPVVYTDFLSMYTTVNGLMGLWRFLIAREIKVVKHCESEIIEFLKRLTPESLFDPATWKRFPAFVRIIPNGDILPSRSKYSVESNDWQVAINHLYGIDDNPNNASWFSLPDVVASVLLSGQIPEIVDAFRIEPIGKLEGLKPLKLRGAVKVDPDSKDLFKVVIEERKRPQARENLSDIERERLDKSLKVFANATSYGIFAEMNRQESDQEVKVVCHSIDPEPYTCRVAHPEEPGEYCFPPLASLITGAARLMLALLEHSVTKLGGTYAMEDTDSMAIVATEHGGIIQCPGGTYRTPDGQEGIKALTRKQVQGISEKFSSLNPYDKEAIPGSVLKIEDDNFDPATGKQRQLHCVAISAKRYALFLLDKGEPILLRRGVNNKDDRWSKHGLGHLLNPTDAESQDRDWIARVWLGIIRRALGLHTTESDFEGVPAIGRISVSSPAVMRCLKNLNDNKSYPDQVKPFNFLLTCHVRQFGHPTKTDPERFHLVTPYETDPSQWLKRDWINQYTGEKFGITVAGHHGTRTKARVKTYGDLLREYEFHPESKCADTDGGVCNRQTVGLLQRRQIKMGHITPIGKESNSLEDVESGLVHSEQNVYTEYPDPRHDEWETRILPALKKISLNRLVKMSGMSDRALKEVRAGRSRPHRKNQQLLSSIVIRTQSAN